MLLGTPNAESSRLYALTVTEGDPSWAGALAGASLNLPVYHIIEEAVKTQIAPDTYEEHVALMEVVLEVRVHCQGRTGCARQCRTTRQVTPARERN